MKYITTIGEREFKIEILDESHVILDGISYQVDFKAIADQPVFSLLVDGQSFEAYVYPAEHEWQVMLHGRSYDVLVEDERARRLRAASGEGFGESKEFTLKAPMPGLIVSLLVDDGQEVEAGDVLIILESMKMQNELKSPRAGMVGRLRVKSGDNVEYNETILSVG